MLRLRRYRAHIVFAVIALLALIHFSGIQAWKPSLRSSSRPAAKAGGGQLNKPPSNSGKTKANNEKLDEKVQNPHGFAPEPLTPEKPTPHVEPLDDSIDYDDDDNNNDPPAQNDENAKPNPNSPAETRASQPQKPLVQGEEAFTPAEQGRLEVPDLPRPSVRWQKQPEHFPVSSKDVIPLPTGEPKTSIPKIQAEPPAETEEQKRRRESKLALIKQAFQHAWEGYKKNSMGRDELNPMSGESRDPFMGWGATLVDSLDALWIMGLKPEFEEAVEATKRIDFGTSARKDIPMFETVIRYLGGLIGAYDISGAKYPALLDKAKELAEILMGAFDTPNRMPDMYYHWAPAYASQPHRSGTHVVLAELGSLSMEFTRLSQITGEDKYYNAIARITNALETWQDKTKLPGLWPAHLDASGCNKVPTSGKQTSKSGPEAPMDDISKKPAHKQGTSRDERNNDPVMEDAEPADYDAKPYLNSAKKKEKEKPTKTEAGLKPKDWPDQPDDYDCVEQGLASSPKSSEDLFTLGALADSTYEYLPKEYLLLGGQSDQYRTMYENAMDSARKYLLFRPMLPEGRDVRFLASVTFSQAPKADNDQKFQYEGSHLACFAGAMFGVGAVTFGLEKDLDIAKKLTDGCVWAYESTATGIMPETFDLLPCESMESCEWNQTRYYDAIDPFESARKAKLQFWAEQDATLDEAADTNSNSDNNKGDGLTPTHEMEREMDVVKRGLEIRDAPGGADDAPTKTKRDVGGVSRPKSTLLTHEEYAETRIKEERLPAGMTQVSSAKYLLRPEAIESVWVLHRITGDDYWRQKGWQMFTAAEEHSRTTLANSAIKDVTSEAPVFMGQMESFWLGETLKYFYLLFSEPDVVSLDDYVVNTEAHPMKRPVTARTS